MSKNTPTERVWHASLLILGSVVALTLAVQLLTDLWGWLLLAAGLVLLAVIVRAVLRHRRDNW